MQRHSCLLPILFCLFIILPPSSLHSFYPNDYSRPLITIAFGSCNQQDLPQPLWPVIIETEPDLWIWAGDNVYGDSPDTEVLKEKYQQQYNQPDYQVFRKSVPIIGTWDDHDYGENNSGKWFQSKEAAQQLALDFLEEPDDSLRRSRKGIYTSYIFGPAEKQVKILLIDDRYHADLPGPQSDLLGEEQWHWLESELTTSTAQINLIVTGIQFLQEEHRYEKWSNFPRSRNRLLNFIRKNKIPGVIFLSGDRHIHEFAMKDDEETAYPLVDFTSSGLTHPWLSFPGEPNKDRVGEVFNELGFGVLRFDWDAPEPSIHLQIHNKENEILHELVLNMNDLQPSE